MLKPAIIALTLLTVTSPALAKAQKLPFVGTRYFNFDTGVATVQSITITKNGMAIFRFHGTTNTVFDFKAKFQNPMPIKGSNSYYQIKDNKILLLDENKNLVYGCYSMYYEDPNDDRCMSTLTP